MIKDIIYDTLKKDGKWSRTSLTMFTAWLIACWLAISDYLFNGFKYEVFVTFVGVALGSKLTDSIGTRISKKQ
jgi:hypothetical protein